MASVMLSPYSSKGLFVLSFMLFSLFSAPAKAAVPAVYVFGDSLADVGNNDYLKLSVLKADFPHNGVDYPGGKATGRFSNGKNSADFLAEKLGLPSSPPFLSIPSNSNNTQAFLNGISFASGGAGVLDSTNPGQCLTFNKQIEYFSTVYTELVQQQGSAQVQAHLSNSIFAFIIGSNDILAYTRSISHRLKSNPQQFVASMVSTLQGQLQRIYNLGARKFAFVSTGPIGCCPAMRSQNKTTGDCSEEANSMSLLYSEGAASVLQQMSSEFSDMSYSFFNTSIRVLDFIQNPAANGFTDVKAACCGLGNLNAKIACLPVSSLCPNRKDHLFWDLFHPSETTAELLSISIFQGSPPEVYPINVKQLSEL